MGGEQGRVGNFDDSHQSLARYVATLFSGSIMASLVPQLAIDDPPGIEFTQLC
jgi:hypothetical protein